MEGVSSDTEMERVLSGGLGNVFVASDPGSLQSFGRQLLLLVRDQVGHKGEEVDRRLLVADVVDADLGVRHAAAVAGLDERLLVLETITLGRTATHDDNFVNCGMNGWSRSRLHRGRNYSSQDWRKRYTQTK